MTSLETPPQSVYIHIPFCRSICHYCDFAKTALYTQEQTDKYINQLTQQFSLIYKHHNKTTLKSVFLGGGTPGMFDSQYKSLFQEISKLCTSDTEISIETNPEDITKERVEIWKDLGINRVSMGVQTFDPDGLSFLKRNHSVSKARKAIDIIANAIPNLNIDLIYGWPQQNSEILQKDLKIATESPAKHLSLYNLTYEPQTPIGRQKIRGKLTAVEDDLLADFYELIMNTLQDKWDHEEVSNWSKPGFSCKHNWIYWNSEEYLGLGCGAHGFLKDQNIGTRYSFPRSLKKFLEAQHKPYEERLNVRQNLINLGADVETDRTLSSWLLEVVSSAIRTRDGVKINQLEEKLQEKFMPTSTIKAGLAQGLIDQQGSQLVLDPREFFRESAWSAEVARSFPLAYSSVSC